MPYSSYLLVSTVSVVSMVFSGVFCVVESVLVLAISTDSRSCAYALGRPGGFYQCCKRRGIEGFVVAACVCVPVNPAIARCLCVVACSHR